VVADYLGLPFIYVSPEAKIARAHETQKKLKTEAKSKRVVIEELISTGKGAWKCREALKKYMAHM